jgi:hypothetical protein
MAADKQVKFVLDLDVKEFTEQGLKAKGVLSSLTNSEGITGLVEHLTHASLALGTLGAAAFAFKSAIDLTMEAEHLKQIDAQFAALTSSAGISTSALKEGLDKSAAGLVDNNDLLEIANRAIVKMGKSAEKLPEIMEVARKATQVFGGDLKSNFENITTAISNGNSRMLKQYGITVDSTKAIQDFAKANGIAANEVSEAGKRQAIMNAALAQAGERFKGVSGDLDKTSSILAITKNAFKEIGDIFVLVFDKTIGPGLKRFLIGVKDAAVSLKTYFQATFGEGLDQSNAQIAQTEKKVKDLQHTIESLQKQKKENVFTIGDQAILDQSIQKLHLAEAQLDKLKEKNKEMRSEEKSDEKSKQAESGGRDDDIVNQEVKKKNEEKFQQDLFAIRQKYLQEQSNNVQSFDQIERNIKDQNELQDEQNIRRLDEIKNNQNLTDTQRAQLMDEQHKLYQEQMIQREEENDKTRARMLDRYVKNSTNAADGIGRAFAAQSARSKRDMADFGKRGQEVMQSFQRHSTYAFEKMGEEMVKGKNIAQAAGDAMKSIFLNVIADRAIAEGSMMMLSGIWPPNPLALGAGAGLIALGGALRTLGGGSGSVPAGGAGGGLGSADGVSLPVTNTDSSSGNMPAVIPQKTVSVNIAGNLFNTSETQRTLMDMIRQETDATDYNYNKIGV